MVSAVKIWLYWLVLNSLLLTATILHSAKEPSLLNYGWFLFDAAFIFLASALYSVISIPFLAAWFYLEEKFRAIFSVILTWFIPLILVMACILTVCWLTNSNDLVQLFIPFTSSGFWAIIIFITSFTIALYATKKFD